MKKKPKPSRRKRGVLPVTPGWLSHIGGDIHGVKAVFKTNNQAIPYILVERLRRGAIVTPVYSLALQKFGEPIPVFGRADLLGSLKRLNAVFRNRLYCPNPVDGEQETRSTRPS